MSRKKKEQKPRTPSADDRSLHRVFRPHQLTGESPHPPDPKSQRSLLAWARRCDDDQTDDPQALAHCIVAIHDDAEMLKRSVEPALCSLWRVVEAGAHVSKDTAHETVARLREFRDDVPPTAKFDAAVNRLELAIEHFHELATNDEYRKTYAEDS